MQAELSLLFRQAMIDYASGKGVPLSLPNTAFAKPANKASQPVFLKAHSLPVTPELITVCGEARYRWLLQVSIYCRDGRGDVEPLEYADDIRDTAFPIHSELSGENHTFQIITPPNPSPPIPMDGWFSIPVTFTVQTIH